MSEYMEQYAVSKIIGSAPGYVGYEEGGQLSEKVRRHPYSVVLFDEIEKAHPDVFNILLQILDEGHITDSQGHRVNFKNTVIIMTSNVGAQRIIAPKTLGFADRPTAEQDYDRMQKGVMEEVKKIFRPEFINRIDEIRVFHALSKEEMGEITMLLASDLIKRAKTQLGINLKITAALRNHIVEKYSDAKMGARPLKRAIQSVIEDPLAEKILAEECPAGSTVTAGFRGGEVVFTVSRKPGLEEEEAGSPADETQQKVREGQVILCNGKPVARNDKLILLAFHKPEGIECTTARDVPDNIVDYLQYPERVFPVGRLDKNSSGLILLTNAGDISDQILRSANYHEKEYLVTVNKPLTREFLKSMQEGVEIELEDGKRRVRTRPCRVEAVGKCRFRIVLTQGLNRQIRRMCQALGYKVQTLQRIRIMNISLGNLPEGHYRHVTEPEIRKLMKDLQKKENRD
jgi:pseudouridine synthase